MPQLCIFDKRLLRSYEGFLFLLVTNERTKTVYLFNFKLKCCRYDIGNCLFEAAYDEVLDKCKCTPYYHWGVVDLPTILQERPFCKVRAEIR